VLWVVTNKTETTNVSRTHQFFDVDPAMLDVLLSLDARHEALLGELTTVGTQLSIEDTRRFLEVLESAADLLTARRSTEALGDASLTMDPLRRSRQFVRKLRARLEGDEFVQWLNNVSNFVESVLRQNGSIRVVE
tara:strand:- start:2008 stop:2412 length:405 start_codon:yes stop_codon:yes gene_type:complete